GAVEAREPRVERTRGRRDDADLRVAAEVDAARAVARERERVVDAAGAELLEPAPIAGAVVAREPGVGRAEARGAERALRVPAHVHAARSIGRGGDGAVGRARADAARPEQVAVAVETREPAIAAAGGHEAEQTAGRLSDDVDAARSVGRHARRGVA